MAWKNLTASGSVLIAPKPSKLLITVNAALTGTITVTDGAATVATITNPAVGSFFQYWDFTGDAAVNPSAICDITVNSYGGFGPK